MNRQVCVFTGSRAEYGLLKHLMKDIQSTPGLDLLILASGAHLDPAYGMTGNEIEADAFTINEKIDIQLDTDAPEDICRSMGLGITSYSEALQRLKPDLVVLLGDRYETFAMATAATVCRFPICHIHGGEITQGVIDEAFRHSITKMSHLHLTCADEYRKRVVQLGEQPEYVYNVGALGTGNIKRMKLLHRGELEKQIGFNIDVRYLLVTYHPVTLENATAGEQFLHLLDVLDSLKNIKIIFTKANADPNGYIINKMIDQYVEQAGEKAIAFTSMGQLRYLSAMKYAAAVVGNSSSGIIEAASFCVPTVNVGDRQKGRIRSANVIDCGTDISEIKTALDKALSNDFKHSLSAMQNPFEQNDTIRKIVKVIKHTDLKQILKKQFYDLL